MTITIIVAVLFTYIGIPWLYSRHKRLMLKKLCCNSNTIALTFDDGPSEKMTGDILKLLNKYKAKATFFLLGKAINGHEAIVKKIHEQGHEIGSHGYEHINHWQVNPVRAVRDISQGLKAIDKALGTIESNRPYRPPYGKLNLISLIYLLMKKQPIVYWSAPSGDTYKPELRNKLLTAEKADKLKNAVVLLHDFERTDYQTNLQIIEWVRCVLRAAKKNNIRLSTVSELLEINKH